MNMIYFILALALVMGGLVVMNHAKKIDPSQSLTVAVLKILSIILSVTGMIVLYLFSTGGIN